MLTSSRAVAGLVCGLTCVTVTVAFARSTAARLFDDTDLAPDKAASADGNAKKRPSPHFDGVVALLNERGFACSGVLVHARVVLTARHCLNARRVVFGADVADARAVRSVARRVAAPNAAIDMGLLVLDAEAPAQPYTVQSRTDGSPIFVVGFGCTDLECKARPGRRAYFRAMLHENARSCDRGEAARTGCISGYEMILSRTVDTCRGDSGGAVLQSANGSWNVVAITSRAVADSVVPCGDGGIYVRVEPQRDWIRKELGKL